MYGISMVTCKCEATSQGETLKEEGNSVSNTDVLLNIYSWFIVIASVSILIAQKSELQLYMAL